MWKSLSSVKTESVNKGSMEALAAASCVPYICHVDDTTLRTLDGMLVQTVRLGGFPFDTADVDEIDLRKKIRNQLWKTFGTSNLAVYHHLVRRRKITKPEGIFKDAGFAADLNIAWCERLAHRKLYENEIYISLIHKPGAGAVKSVDHFLKSLSHKADDEERQAFEQRAMAELSDAMRALREVFKPYQPELLGVSIDKNGVPCSELMRFYGFLMNLKDRKYEMPQRPISEVLPVARAIFRNETIELRHMAESIHAGMLSIKEYSMQTAANIYDKMLTLPFEFCMTQSFRFEERARSEAAIKQQRGRLINAGDTGLSQIAALDVALDESKGEAGFGLHHHTITVWDADAGLIAGKLAAIDAELAENGITSIREDVNLEAAFYAQLPCNFKFVARAARISTKNFASFASCHNYLGGLPGSVWGPAITVLPSASGTAYHFNLHVADRGNTLVLGPTGQGKTLTMSFLFAQSLKLGGRRVFLDKDRGMEIFVRAIGGSYFRIESQRPTGWNPLQLPDTPASAGFLVEWMESLLTDPGGEPIGADDRQRIKRVISSVFDLSPHLRQLRHIAPMFGNPDQDKLAKRLLDWYEHPVYGRGQHAWVFDNLLNELDTSNPVIGFDMTYILDARQIRPPALMWLFFVVEGLLDGQPWRDLPLHHQAVGSFNAAP